MPLICSALAPKVRIMTIGDSIGNLASISGAGEDLLKIMGKRLQHLFAQDALLQPPQLSMFPLP